MALVQGTTMARPCRRLRPRGRQRSPFNGGNERSALLYLLTAFQLVGLISAGQALNSTPTSMSTSTRQTVAQTTPLALPSMLPLAKDNATPSWRRMGLSETVTNNEQDLINKILRDDTSSSVPTSFQYTLVPATASVVTPLPSLASGAVAGPVAMTKSDTDRLPAPSTEPAAGESSQPATGNGKINQSRSKEEQEAFNKRFGGASPNPGQGDHHSPSGRRRRRAVNVVVNTFNGDVGEEVDRRSGSSASKSAHSNFLLKSIVTGIEDCLQDKCSDKFHSLSTSDIPQLLVLPQSNSSGRSSSSESRERYSNVNVLNLSDSGLRTLPHGTMGAIADKLPNIEFIDLSINQLKSANLALSGPLAFLNFSQNQLTRFHLQRGTLAYLDLSHNNLATGNGEAGRTPQPPQSIELGAGCANITMLDLSHNHLGDFLFLRVGPTTPCPLRVLNFAYNQLHSIKRDTFAGAPHLEILSLAHNLVAEIENDTFVHLQSLQYLDLSDNLLNASSVRALQGIPDLIGLSLARNPRLGDALQGFVASWSLKELDISGTGLCEIPAALAQSVRTLNLAHNHFQVIRSGDLDSYPLLFNLNLDHCNVAEIEDDALGRLEMLATLNLNHNNLHQVPISLPANLMALHLEDNSIMELQANRFAHLTNLKVLSLSGNKIQYLPALPLRKLLVLNLVSAELHGLSQLVVQTSPHLKDLRLDNNPVKCADLLGIAEWATPCRDVDSGDMPTTSNDYHDLDDEELRELADEEERNNLKYLLDFVASRSLDGEDKQRDRSRQLLSTSSDKAHLCRSSGLTNIRLPPPQTTTVGADEQHLNGQVEVTSPATTLAGDKSPKEDVQRETDTGETEQIPSNLPNPPKGQTVTPSPPTPPSRIIKTLPRSQLPLPHPTGASSAGSAKTSGNEVKEAEAILSHRQNNGSLQITGHLNSNKRSGRDHDADDDDVASATPVIVREEESKIFEAETNSSSSSALSAQLGVQNERTEAGKSSESGAIKLANNKNANIDGRIAGAAASGVHKSSSTSSIDGSAGDKKSKKPVDRVNNKKLIKLTDSSNIRNLMPYIEKTGQQRSISAGAASAVFAQQSMLPSSITPATPPLPLTHRQSETIKDKNVKTTENPLASTTALLSSHVTSTPSDTPSTTATPPEAEASRQLTRLITLSPAGGVSGKSLPISSKQIIFQRPEQQRQLPQITPTRDDVHNLLSVEGDSSSSPLPMTATPASVAKVVLVTSAASVVNETRKMGKNLPKTFAIPLHGTPPSSPLAGTAKPSLTPPTVILRNDDDNAVAAGDRNENGKLMSGPGNPPKLTASSSPLLQPTKGLIEDTSSDGDNDNPLLELWQQSSTHLSSHPRKTISSAITMPGANPGDALSVISSTSNARGHAGAVVVVGDDVNESKNLIRTKSEWWVEENNNNKKASTTRSHAAVETSPSLKSETILINDRNNDDSRDKSHHHQDDSAGGGRDAAAGDLRQAGEGEDFVLKLMAPNKKEQQKPLRDSGKIYVAENSLSVAELVLPHSDSRDNPRNANSNNNPRSRPQADDTNRRRPDKLLQLNTNSIHGVKDEEGEQDGVVVGRAKPWNEHIKADGRRDKAVDSDDERLEDAEGVVGDADSDNYHHRQPHPGLFIVIGATIGIVLSIGLFRCKQSWWAHRHYPLPDTGGINQTYTQRHMMRRQSDYNQNQYDPQITRSCRPSPHEDVEGAHEDGAFPSPATDSFSQQRFGGSEDDYYRCTNWRDRAAGADNGKCDEEDFVDVQLTPKCERKSVKFDLLPMKILSPSDHQPFLLNTIMTSDCDYASIEKNNNNNMNNNNSNNDTGAAAAGSVAADRSNKSSTSPLELW